MNSLTFQPLVPVFDANIGVGHRHDRIAPFTDSSQLLEEMSRHGVAKALVYHVQGETRGVLKANETLFSWVENQPSLYPQWMITPSIDCLKQLEQLHSENQVSSVRLSNSIECKLPFVEWLYNDLLVWLSEKKIPLWISLADTSPVEIMETLSHFPDLVSVLVGAHYSHSPLIRPFLQRLPNSYIELSRFESLGKVTELKTEFGTKRFIYGSFYPRYAMGPTLFFVHQLELSQSELESFCARNLENVLRMETLI